MEHDPSTTTIAIVAISKASKPVHKPIAVSWGSSGQPKFPGGGLVIPEPTSPFRNRLLMMS